jgi:hypothetical protein
VWRQLVQRRLWPVAILLVAALAAVPLALAEQPEEAAPPAPPVAQSGETALATQPIVAPATVSDRSKRRKVLGTPKNPFGLADDANGSAEPPDSKVATTAQEPAPAKTGGGSAPSAGSDAPSSGGVTEPPAATAPAEPKPKPKQYDMYDLTVRFGDATGGAERKTLKRLEPLPSAEAPVLIYLGVMRDGKTAVFLVDHGIAALGDGDCSPTPETCEAIRLREGDTEFLDVKDEAGNVTAQYQLDLIKIHRSKTASASRAKASRAGSKAGRRLLKARAAGAPERLGNPWLRGWFAGATVALP